MRGLDDALRRALLCLLAMLTLTAVEAEAAVRAFLDRDSVTLGETLTLNIESDGVAAGEPDLSALEADFHLRGTSSSSQISLVNGRSSTRQLWAVALEPKTEGVIGIPALDIGGERTEPLTLTVRPAPAGAVSSAGDEVFLEVETTTREPYVQQQVGYVVRLYYGVDLTQGQLDEPVGEGVRVQRLGADTRFQRRIGERRYEVIERRYALVPERSGVLHIRAPRFVGDALDGPRRGLFGGGRRVQASGEAVELRVRAQPAAAASPWLPAQQLALADESGALDGPFRVGEPISLALRLRARGLSAEQLPELRLDAIDGAQVYPDQESSQNREDGQWLLGERSRRFAIVPARAGVIEVPALRVSWWNVETDRAEVAELPARRLEILPAAPAAAAPDAASGVDAPARSVGAVANGWRYATFALAALWLATVLWLVWRWPRPPRQSSAAPSAPTAPTPDLGRVLAAGDPARIAAALRAAARAAGHSGDLSALALVVAQPTQAQALRDLDRWLYGGGEREEQAALLSRLRAAFGSGLRWHEAQASAGDADRSGLPRLYRG
ncbi:MAG: BatD family protein [Lysobacteraceae bacterium]